MTVYIYTPEQHKQVLDEYLERSEFWGESLDYRWKHLQAASEKAKVTLAMLKAMQPVEPFQNFEAWDEHGEPLQIILYTPTKAV